MGIIGVAALLSKQRGDPDDSHQAVCLVAKSGHPSPGGVEEVRAASPW
jgi:hypothetical protein